MVQVEYPKYFPKKYNGEYVGGWAYCPVLIPNMWMRHWFGHVHYFVCYCGGRQFTYIKDNQEELTDGGGTWVGFDMFGIRWGA